MRVRRLAILLFILATAACARNSVRIAVEPAMNKPYPFVVDGTVVVTFGLIERTSWNFKMPVKPGMVLVHTGTYKTARLTARVAVNESGTEARYTVEVVDRGRRRMYETRTIPIAQPRADHRRTSS